MEEYKKINLLKGRDFSENFDLALTFIKQNYGTVLKPICIIIPVILIGMYFMPNANSISVTDISAYSNPFDVYREMISLGAVIAYLCMGISLYLINLYIIAYVAEYAKSKDGIVKSGDVWSSALKVALPVFLASIMFVIAVTIGAIFCLIPGIIIYVYFSFYIYVYIAEGRGIIGSFQRSFELVKNNWWVTFGFGLVFYVLIFIGSLIFAIPSYLSIFGTLLDISFLKSDIYTYISNIISSIGTMLLYPVMYLAMGVMYYSHRAKLDGSEMESEIENLGTYTDSEDTNRY